MRVDGVDFILYIYIVLCTHTYAQYIHRLKLYIYIHKYFLSVLCPKFNPAFKCRAHTQLPQTLVTVHMPISRLKLEHLRHEAQLHF